MDITISQFDRTKESTGFLVWQLSNLWQRQIGLILQPMDLTHGQFIILASTYWLGRQGKAHTQVQISKQAQTDIMMTSKVVRTLEEKGYLVRLSNPNDTRERLVRITKEGIDAIGKAQIAITRFEDAFFSTLLSARPGFNGYLREIIKSNL
jgi:MarR family transcriptional regulator, organic hydroperoxide resistance regulator